MKKVIILPIILLLLSGCSIDYNLDIDSSNIKEELKTEVSVDEYNEINKLQELRSNKNLYEYFDSQDIYAFINDNNTIHNYYSKKNGNKLEVNYNYDYNYNNFVNSYLLNTCFDKYSILNEKDYYYVEITGKMYCYYGKTNINVKTKYLMIDENSDKSKNNTYTWIIDKNNVNDVNIKFQISKSKYNSKNNSLDNTKRQYIKAIIVFLIIIGCTIGLIFVKKKGKNND